MKYDEEFKKVAVKKYLDGQSVASISREIGVNENTIHKWKKALLSVNGDVDQEKLALRKRIFELEQECEILKNVWLRRRSQSSNELFWHQAGRMQQMYPASVL
jgi:transposase